MAFFRYLNFGFPKILNIKNAININEIRVLTVTEHILTQERSFRKGYGRTLRAMKFRRKLAGPDRLRKRSEWDNWNYKAELYAFNQRLHENITEETLRCAFIHESYIKSEEERRKELDIPTQDVTLDLRPNTSLIADGRDITSDFLKRYLRHCFPLLPEEGVLALHNHLLSDEVLAHVSFNIGTKDLVLCSEYPPENHTLASSLLAIVGSIAKDDSKSKAEKFVLDLICTQLVGKDVFDLWDLKDPCAVLNSILVKHGMSEYEPRLIFESGRNTIMAIYNVGIYSDKKFLGRAPGETLNIAEELAVFDCLRKIFQIRESEKPISPKKLSMDVIMNEKIENPSVENWYSESLKLSKCF
ncbi:large ribosomal subunit protein mL44 [Parasteatoda tepidariorum]|uniref:large ribosomal subunit protein mL44 n=1 Tax=Parasteatoda tepidariorum TaxID=114398 RepID=UPI00077F891C|nr:39S ribosomal protein L44, mitochondrial-like [Parasteatoda tepidariorum]